MDATRDEHDEDPVGPGDRPLDHDRVARRSRNHGDAPLELVELRDACLSAYPDDVVAPLERVVDHVAPEFSRGPDDADPQHVAVVAAAEGMILCRRLALEVQRNSCADEFLEGRFVYLVPFTNIDGTPDLPIQAGVEQT